MKIIKNYNNIESTYLIDSEKEWPVISIFSWIHWDEISWILANKKFFEQIDKWEIKINFWKLILVLKSNEEAIKIWKRQVKFNLNRLFRDDIEFWNSYEEKRVIELKKILSKTDYLLDLHSTSWPSIPFLFSEKNVFDFSKNLWVSHIISWWWELWDVISWDTESYINLIWWKWMTFEAWNHKSKDWEKNAYQMILNFLSKLWIINEEYFKIIWNNKQCFLNMISFYKAKSDNFKYKIDIKNFLKIQKWTLIWEDDWEKNFADKDFILVMPKKESLIKKWSEVFFTWKEIKV